MSFKVLSDGELAHAGVIFPGRDCKLAHTRADSATAVQVLHYTCI